MHLLEQKDLLTKASGVFWATLLKGSSESIGLINDSITEVATTHLKDVENSQVSLSIQPISKSWLQAAKQAGGDAINLDPEKGNIIGEQ